MSTPLDEQHSSQRPQHDYTGLLRSLFIIAVIAASAGIIFYLKSATSGPLSPQHLDPNSQLVAHPDTSVADEANVNTAPPAKAPVANDEPDLTPTDSIDHRSPYDAGYEDGYNTGYFDGTRGEYRLTYDESSTYAEAADQKTYRSAYQQGYKAGFDDGRSGKTFSIFNNAEEEDEEEENTEDEQSE